MDEMRLKLSTKIMRGLVAKIVEKVISKKLGLDINLDLKEIEIDTIGDRVHLHVNVDGDLAKDDFINILKKNGLD